VKWNIRSYIDFGRQVQTSMILRRKRLFIKNNMSRKKNTISDMIKTTVSSMTMPKKNAGLRLIF
jgi:hypothetical protein